MATLHSCWTISLVAVDATPGVHSKPWQRQGKTTLQTQGAPVALHEATDQCALQLAHSHRTRLSALQTEALQHRTQLGGTESNGTAPGENQKA